GVSGATGPRPLEDEQRVVVLEAGPPPHGRRRREDRGGMDGRGIETGQVLAHRRQELVVAAHHPDLAPRPGVAPGPGLAPRPAPPEDQAPGPGPLDGGYVPHVWESMGMRLVVASHPVSH